MNHALGITRHVQPTYRALGAKMGDIKYICFSYLGRTSCFFICMLVVWGYLQVHIILRIYSYTTPHVKKLKQRYSYLTRLFIIIIDHISSLCKYILYIGSIAIPHYMLKIYNYLTYMNTEVWLSYRIAQHHY